MATGVGSETGTTETEVGDVETELSVTTREALIRSDILLSVLNQDILAGSTVRLAYLGYFNREDTIMGNINTDGRDAPATEPTQFRKDIRDQAEAKRKKTEADAKDRATPLELKKEETDMQ